MFIIFMETYTSAHILFSKEAGFNPKTYITFYRFRQEVCSWFGLFDPVALHGLPLFIEAQKPSPARLLLSVEHGAVDHIVVLEHRFLKLTLSRKQLLRR